VTTSVPTALSCPVCNASADTAELFLAENIDTSRLSGFSFASRKEPEYMCHRLVRCSICELVYAVFPPGQDELANAYHSAEYDSAEEASDAADAYLKAISPILAELPQRESVLEIGAGTGVFLERLASQGFSNLVGVEPSTAAITAAPASRRDWIHEGIFREQDFSPESFDLICCFMTMEHVSRPGELARAAFRLLRPGGAFVTVTHDYRSSVNRLLGRRSPIIDIEHLQLFSKRSIREMFARSGYADIAVRDFSNRYSVRYWVRLSPIPSPLKKVVLSAINFFGARDVKLTFNVGNMIASGFRGG
jgi:SAM-dependent methyltransferase